MPASRGSSSGWRTSTRTISPAAKKRQNKITEYRKMLLAWKAQGIMTLAGYILGFPADTPETIRRDIAIIQNELPLDILEFFCLTPLPGSEDHQMLWKTGVAMDLRPQQLRRGARLHAHPRMSKQEWEAIYREAWSLYYTPRAHEDAAAPRGGDRRADGQPRQAAGDVRDDGSASRTCIRCRAASSGSSIRPSAGPACRAKAPGSSGRASPGRRCASTRILAGTIGRLPWLERPSRAIPMRAAYMDQALTPVGDDETRRLTCSPRRRASRRRSAIRRRWPN